MGLDSIVASVSIIHHLKNAQVIGSATGFFYRRGDSLFLVTNRHVVTGEGLPSRPDTLRLILHRNQFDTTQNGNFDIALYAGGVPQWKAHQSYTNADVVLLKLDRVALQTYYYVVPLEAIRFLPSNFILQSAEDVFVVGYPLSFYDKFHNLPIFRSAMISSVYGVPFNNDPCFLVDGNLHPGMSGSPVFTKPKNVWIDSQGNTSFVTGSTYYFLGIHSASLSIPTAPTSSIPLGLHITWYAQLIEEIAASFP